METMQKELFMTVSDLDLLPETAGKGKIIQNVEHLSDCPARNIPSTGLDHENHTLCDIRTRNNRVDLNLSTEKADIYLTTNIGRKHHKVRMPIWFCPFCGVRVRVDGEEKSETRPAHYVDGIRKD